MIFPWDFFGKLYRATCGTESQLTRSLADFVWTSRQISGCVTLELEIMRNTGRVCGLFVIHSSCWESTFTWACSAGGIDFFFLGNVPWSGSFSILRDIPRTLPLPAQSVSFLLRDACVERRPKGSPFLRRNFELKSEAS